MVISIVWIVFILSEQKKLELHKRACENKDFCTANMPCDDTKIIKFYQYQNSDKAPFIIYADLECIIEEIDGCENNSENLSTTKVSKHISSDFHYSQYILLEA